MFEPTYCNQDATDIGIEAICLSVAIFDLQATLDRFEGACDMRVYPKGPQCVVEVKDDHFGQRQAICEGRGPLRLLRESCGGCGVVGARRYGGTAGHVGVMQMISRHKGSDKNSKYGAKTYELQLAVDSVARRRAWGESYFLGA
jgi:hypothetical protein